MPHDCLTTASRLPHDCLTIACPTFSTPSFAGVAPELAATAESLLQQEWLVTNGLGGYASASVPGSLTRKYHGLLVAALPNPIGRTVLLNHVVECVALADGTRIQLTGEERTGNRLSLPGFDHLHDFRLEAGMPVWEFTVGDALLERRVLMPHRQNTTFVLYRLLHGSGDVRLELRPAVHFRGYEAEVTTPMQSNYRLSLGDVHEITCDDGPATLRLKLYGADQQFVQDPCEHAELHYRVEQDSRLRVTRARCGAPARSRSSSRLAAGPRWSRRRESRRRRCSRCRRTRRSGPSSERRRRLLRPSPRRSQRGAGAELVLAADQFVITPAGRHRDAARAVAEGDESAQRDRRLSLVHRLGPRHDDQPRRTDA